MAHLAKLRVFEDLVFGSRAKRLGCETRRLRRHSHAQGSAVRHRFIYTTYILDRAAIRGLGMQPPAGAAHMNEKVYTAWFPECCAPTLISRDMHDMGNSCASTARWSASRSTAWEGARSRARPGRQEPQRGARDADRLRHALRHCAALPAGDRDGGDCRVILVDGRAGAFRPAADAGRGRPPRQSGAGASAESRPSRARPVAVARSLGLNCKRRV